MAKLTEKEHRMVQFAGTDFIETRSEHSQKVICMETKSFLGTLGKAFRTTN